MTGKDMETVHKCRIFRCHRRRGWYCCSYCGEKEECGSPCLNSPERCGVAFTENREGE